MEKWRMMLKERWNKVVMDMFIVEWAHYSFANCGTCNGPIIGHRLADKACEGIPFDRESVEKIEGHIVELDCFKQLLSEKGTIVVRTCAHCKADFVNRAGLNHHVKTVHDVEENKGGMDLTLIMQAIKLSNESLSEAMKTMVMNSPDRRPAATMQLTKAKLLPMWIDLNFEQFRHEVEAWTNGNKDPEQDKYHLLIVIKKMRQSKNT
jgi:hypothetical protein